MPPGLIDQDTPVDDEDDAARVDAELAFVRGRRQRINPDVYCRGLSGACRQVECIGPSSVGEYLIREARLPEIRLYTVADLEESGEVRKGHGSASTGSTRGVLTRGAGAPSE